MLARLVADKMQASLGRPVLVENKTGAGGRIAAEGLKTAPADGSQIMIANIVMMVLNPLVEKVGYDPVADFAPIARAGDYQIPLATGPMTGAKDFASLVAWLKGNPDKANYGVPAPGSLPHLYALQVARVAGVPMTMVPFRGGAPIATALIGSQIPAGLSAVADFAEQHRGGALRIVALSGTQRMPTLPDVPTFAELGLKGFDENGWNGFFAPAGTPAAVIERYNAAIVAALRDADVKAKLEALGFLVTTSTAQALGKQVADEREKWKPLLVEAGVVK
ncbi:MAG: ABC transporter substrate-binding protein [Gemmatimonadaceae bacterium]|nr:ABC transporter substrate-binding protein [Gemmatimonadaceae bacterium]